MTTQTATTSPFEVTTWDQTSYDEPAEGPVLARVVVHKTFSGDLAGTSVGEGLLSGSEGAQSYMVLERVTGTLGGRVGTFVMQHGGTVAGGEVVHQWGLVIPDSGTGEMAGLTGTAAFEHDDAGARLSLDYTL